MTHPISGIRRHQYNALWLIEHLLYSNWAHKKRMALGERLGQGIDDAAGIIGEGGANHEPVPVIDGSNPEEFIRMFRNRSHPVVLKNVATNWPLFEKWTPDFFAEQYPEDPVILFDAAVENSKLAYTEGKETKSTSLADFIRSMKEGGKDYARLLPLLDQHPELLNDMDVSWLHTAANNGRKKSIKHQLFIGGPRTSTSMHCAIGSNLFIQVHGRKQWWIYSNKEAPLLEPIVDRSVFFRSQANSENPEGIFKKARGWTVVLEPGDILYNPPFFWHQVRGLDTNIGVGFRWFALESILKISIPQFIMTLTASNPSVRQANKVKHNFAKVYAELLENQKAQAANKPQ